jgi:uncharacterized phage protein (TIGR02218 family)
VTYSVSEASTQDGSPVYKFLFSQGGTEYRYTSAAYFISDSAGTWTPTPINASAIQQSGEIAKNGIRIVLPRDNEVAQMFLGKVPESTTSLTIYRWHDETDLGEFAVVWKGRVASAQAGGDEVTLECEDIFTSMRRPGLRARYQKGCRHALYSEACGVNDYNYAVPAQIIGESGFTVTVTGIVDSAGDSTADQFTDGYFNGGIIEAADGARRYILRHAGGTLTLLSPFDSIDIDSVPQEVTLYPGCRHNTNDCKNKFNNLDNYGGFPYIPGKNPFRNSVEGSIV